MSKWFLALIAVAAPVLLQALEIAAPNDGSRPSDLADSISEECGLFRGKRGPRGDPGPPGPPGGAGGMTVFFSLPLSYMPGYDFAFLPNGMGGGGTPNTFDPATTNGQNVAYSAFLVPFDGTISNLTIRLDLATVASSEISPELTFTVYASSTTLGASSALGSWTATALELSTGILTMAPGSSLTAAFQNVTNTAAVAAGTILTVVVHSEGLATFDLQPAHLSASFSYSPN